MIGDGVAGLGGGPGHRLLLGNVANFDVGVVDRVTGLPLEQLLRLLQSALRVLRPGGMIILETPNPENLQVAAYSFWMDPTHQRPLPPPLLLHMAQHTGFVDCHIQRSSPWPSDQQTPGLPQPLPKLLYAEQDYALIARKPAL